MVRADISISECDFHNVEVNTCRIPMALVKAEPWRIEMPGSLPLTDNLMTYTTQRVQTNISTIYPINMQPGHAVFQMCMWFTVCRNTVGFCTMNSFTQWFAWESFWFIVSLSIWQDSELPGMQWQASAICHIYIKYVDIQALHPYVVFEHHSTKSWKLIWPCASTYFWPYTVSKK